MIRHEAVTNARKLKNSYSFPFDRTLRVCGFAHFRVTTWELILALLRHTHTYTYSDNPVRRIARNFVPVSFVCTTMAMREKLSSLVRAFAIANTSRILRQTRGTDNKIALTVDHEFTIRYRQIGLYLRWSSHTARARARLARASRTAKSCISNERASRLYFKCQAMYIIDWRVCVNKAGTSRASFAARRRALFRATAAGV